MPTEILDEPMIKVSKSYKPLKLFHGLGRACKISPRLLQGLQDITTEGATNHAQNCRKSVHTSSEALESQRT